MRLLGLTFALSLVACAPGRSLLAIDLRTDLVVGEEIDEVVVRLDGAEVARGSLTEADDLIEGARIAELAEVEHGSRRLDVELLLEGAVVIERPQQVELSGPFAITIVVTRGCRGVDCASDGARACWVGSCVVSTCSPETPQTCPDAECLGDDDCLPAVACAAGRCLGGVCLATDRGTCGDGRWCDPERGCVGRRAEAIRPIEVQVATLPDGSDAIPLAGETLTGDVYPFVVDQPHLMSLTVSIEPVFGGRPGEERTAPPWGLTGAEPGLNAMATQLVPDGAQELQLTATFDDESTEDVSIPFVIANGLTDGFFYSADAYRTGARALDGAAVAPPVYIVWVQGARTGIDRVRFYLDDPMRLAPLGVSGREIRAPYDANGNNGELFGAAVPLAADRLEPGPHTIEVEVVPIAGGAPELVSATFTATP